MKTFLYWTIDEGYHQSSLEATKWVLSGLSIVIQLLVFINALGLIFEDFVEYEINVYKNKSLLEQTMQSRVKYP